MSQFPTAFSERTTAVMLKAADATTAATLERLRLQDCTVHMGLTPAYAEQVLAMAHEPAIREYCPKDLSERFTDRTITEHWLSKGRAFFLLLNNTRLFGYGWAGPAVNRHAPGGETTFALRMGEAGQGKGLAAPFSWLIVAAAAEHFDARHFWLETWGSNGAAVHIYHKLGFQTVTEVPGHRPAADGGEVADTRLYMNLPNELLP